MNAGIGCSSSRSLFVQLHLNPDPFLPGNCETRRRTRRETIAAVINRTNIKILIKYCRRRDTTPEPLISLHRRKKKTMKNENEEGNCRPPDKQACRGQITWSRPGPGPGRCPGSPSENGQHPNVHSATLAIYCE